MQTAGHAAALAALYFIAAKLSLAFAIPPGYASPLWVPSGLALAALLMMGPRRWPGIWVGAALANWFTWWQGDLLGILIVTPLLLSWSARSTLEWTAARVTEGAGLLVLMVLAAQWIFNAPAQPGNPQPLPYVVFPFVLWAALRFRQREVTTVVAVFNGLALWHTIAGRGPLATGGVKGGSGPYFQMERLAIYEEWAERLIARGAAYQYTNARTISGLPAPREAGALNRLGRYIATTALIRAMSAAPGPEPAASSASTSRWLPPFSISSAR